MPIIFPELVSSVVNSSAPQDLDYQERGNGSANATAFVVEEEMHPLLFSKSGGVIKEAMI